MDWPGLLKWSTTYHDGTTDPKNVKMMTKEDKEWLQQAMEAYTYDDVKAMEACFKKLVSLDTNQSDYETTALNLLDELHDYTFSLDNAKNLCVFGGIGWLVDQV